MKAILILAILAILVLVIVYLVKKFKKPTTTTTTTTVSTNTTTLPITVQKLFVMKYGNAYEACGLDATAPGTDKQILYFRHESSVPREFTQLYTDDECLIKFVGAESEYAVITNYTDISNTVNYVMFITSNGIVTQVYQC